MVVSPLAFFAPDAADLMDRHHKRKFTLQTCEHRRMVPRRCPQPFRRAIEGAYLRCVGEPSSRPQISA